jgi:F420-dependent oxidoreductase-like protein
MEHGIHFANFTLPGGSEAIGPILGRTAQAAEAEGCAAFTLMDHYFHLEEFAERHDAMLEGYTALGFLAGRTERMTLGLLVTGVTYRHPGLLAKIVTTLDVVSGGRAQLGIGAAWYEREHLGLGIPFPSLTERFERLEETLQICHQMWSDDEGSFSGTHYQLAETICSPRPVSSPRPRILIGGGGEQKTLRLVARYADACNLFAREPAEVAHKLEVLDRHCADEHRDPAAISRTILGMADPLTDVDGFLASMEQYAALGIDMVDVMPLVEDPVGYVTRLGEEVVPRLAELGAWTTGSTAGCFRTGRGARPLSLRRTERGSGRGRGHEVDNEPGYGFGVLGLGEVAESGQHVERAVGDGVGGSVGVVHRDDAVPLAPNDQHRKAFGEVEPTVGADRLAAGVDDGADSTNERLPRHRVSQRPVGRPHFGRRRVGEPPSTEQPG